MKRIVYSLLTTAVLLAGASTAQADYVLGVSAGPDLSWSYGLRVTGVLSSSPAASLGIQEGDLLYNLNGTDLFNNMNLRDALANSDGNETLSWLRVNPDGSISYFTFAFTLSDDGEQPNLAKFKKSDKASHVKNIRKAKPTSRRPVRKKR